MLTENIRVFTRNELIVSKASFLLAAKYEYVEISF